MVTLHPLVSSNLSNKHEHPLAASSECPRTAPPVSILTLTLSSQYQRQTEDEHAAKQSDVLTVLLLEAPWPDVYRVNRFVGTDGTTDATSAHACEDLGSSFPSWMWANDTCAEFFTWLKGFNSARAAAEGEPAKVAPLTLSLTVFSGHALFLWPPLLF